MITCNTCVKTLGKGSIGSHWICLDCKIPMPKQLTERRITAMSPEDSGKEDQA